MPRIARIVAVGLSHHITQRGNYRQDIFNEDNDYLKYLSWIQEYSKKYHLSLLAYCLMSNHIHFVVIPHREDSLAKTFNTVHMRYAQYVNMKKKERGHLWQGRFYSCVLDASHLLAAIRYVERNPVRARLVRKPWMWKWSSAGIHVGEAEAIIELEDITKYTNIVPSSWREYLQDEEEREFLDSIRRHSSTGHPLGGISFIGQLEKKFKRRLHALPRGRPKKKR